MKWMRSSGYIYLRIWSNSGLTWALEFCIRRGILLAERLSVSWKTERPGESQKSELSRTSLTGLRIAISLSRQMKSHSRMFHHAYGDSDSSPRLFSSRHSAARNTSNRLSTPFWWSLRRAAQWASSPWRYTQEKARLTEHPGWVSAKPVTSSQHLSHGEKEEKISTWIALLENIETRRCLKCSVFNWGGDLFCGFTRYPLIVNKLCSVLFYCILLYFILLHSDPLFPYTPPSSNYCILL